MPVVSGASMPADCSRNSSSRSHWGWDWMGWDGMGWDGMGWDGMGWDGMGWGGLGWSGMGWDGMVVVSSRVGVRSKPCVRHRVGVTVREWEWVGLVMDAVGYVCYIPALGRSQGKPESQNRRRSVAPPRARCDEVHLGDPLSANNTGSLCWLSYLGSG